MDETFDWDGQKASANWLKHRVSFEEASTVFADPRAISIFDLEHSDDEDRFVTIGRSDFSRILVVVHTVRGSTLRIISARRAGLLERRTYVQN